MGGFRRRTCQSAKLTTLGAPSVTFKVTARRSASVLPSVPRCPHVRPAVRSLRSSPPTPAPEVPGRPPPPGPDPLRAPRAHRHQPRTHPQRRRADPALRNPDAEPRRPSDPRRRRARPTREVRVHSGPGVHLGTPGLVPHPCPRPHAGRRCSCQAGTPSPGSPQLPRLLPGCRGWSQGGELGKLVNRRARPPVPPSPARRPLPAAPSLRLPEGDKGRAAAEGARPPTSPRNLKDARGQTSRRQPRRLQALGSADGLASGSRSRAEYPSTPRPRRPLRPRCTCCHVRRGPPRLLPTHLAEPRVRDHSRQRRAARARPRPQTWPAVEGILPPTHLQSPEFSVRARGLPASPGAGPRGRDGLRVGEARGQNCLSGGVRATSSDFVFRVSRLQIGIISALLSG